MQFSAIHLNGSGAANLLEDQMKASASLRQAARDLLSTGPHMRDYYVLEPGSFERALAEHLSRIDRLHSVLIELDALMEYTSSHVKGGVNGK